MEKCFQYFEESKIWCPPLFQCWPYFSQIEFFKVGAWIKGEKNEKIKFIKERNSICFFRHNRKRINRSFFKAIIIWFLEWKKIFPVAWKWHFFALVVQMLLHKFKLTVIKFTNILPVSLLYKSQMSSFFVLAVLV